ncbi:MAG: hypothetical protein Kow00128_22330 [Deltaproteobacteria bacterium]
MSRGLSAASALAALVLLSAPFASAFQKEAGPIRDCRECHTMTPEEAGKILGGAVDNVVAVLPGPIPGIWEVDVEKDGKIYPLYLDYSGKHLVNGQIIRMSDRQNLTGERYTDLNRIDLSTIPLEGAVLLGNPKAARKVIVFDDPDCPWCRKLHGEIRKIVAERTDVAFLVRVYSRNGNPASEEKARSIVCGKEEAAKRLDDAFAGKALPEAKCGTDAVEVTARTAERLGIHGTPAMVLPDGRLISGYLDADSLLELLAERPAAQE